MPPRIRFVRDLDADTPECRLQSTPLYEGLRELGEAVDLTNSAQAEQSTVGQTTSYVVHYKDVPALQACARMKELSPASRVVVLGCDLYSYRDYHQIEFMTDMFVMPSEIHSRMLSAGTMVPVVTVPEAVDAISFLSGGAMLRPRTGRKMCWFGYPESFMKSCASILPVIEAHLRRGTIEQFSLITRPDKTIPQNWHSRIIPYSSQCFAEVAQGFDYVLLSHLPLDLLVNTYIKSVNKAVTALVSGMIPLASDTPNYRALFSELGIERFLFGGPRGLEELLGNLRPEEDWRTLQQAGVRQRVIDERTPRMLAKIFLERLRGVVR